MPSLLTIPPELRDQILKEVLFPPERECPDSPTASQDRTRRVYRSCGGGDATDYHDGHDVWVPSTPFAAPAPHPRAVLLVNRQLYDEASALLAKAAHRETQHRLDLMYVRECGLPSPHTVKRLVFDVAVPPRGTLDENLGFPRGSAQAVMIEAFWRGDVSPHWPRPPRGETHRMVAEKILGVSCNSGPVSVCRVG
ncbi:hypothetical protein SODALDRAFT_334172, partial [Sodiomyces alkalinus F11]